MTALDGTDAIKGLRLLFDRPRVAALTALVTSLIIVAGLTAWQARSNRAAAETRFTHLAQRTADRVMTRLQIYEYGLRGTRGAVIGTGVGQISRDRFRRYAASRDIDREFPGARGMGVIVRVPPAREAAFVEAARQDGYPDFAIRQLAPHAGERYVIQYVEPLGRNVAAVGLDIASEPNRREAAEVSMLTGRATITAPITILQAAERPRRSFLLLLPIYGPDSSAAPTLRTPRDVVAWSYTPLVMDEVLADFDFGGLLVLSLRDLAGAELGPFFRSPGDPVALSLGLNRRVVLSVYGRTWEAEVHATPTFVSELNLIEPRTLALVGVGIACLLTVLVFNFAQSRDRARQVRIEQTRRAAIVDSSDDAIIVESLDGRITDWNRGAEQLFGYTAAEALGKTAAALLLPPTRAAEDAAIRASISRGEAVPSFDTTRQRADGTLLDVSVAAAPIVEAAGHRRGLCKTIRDIGAAKRAERKLKELNATLEQQVRERTESLETAERDLRSILDAVPSVISYWDRDLRNRFANNAHQTWFGQDPKTMPGVHVRDLMDGRFVASIPRMEAALRGEARIFEYTLPPTDGRDERHVVVHYLPDWVGGEVRGFYIIGYDVTQQTLDQRRLAAALRENEALLRTIHQHAIVSVTDARGRITDANEQFCRISGFTREELLGKTHQVINAGMHDRAFWVGMWRTIASGQPWRGEICNRAKNGSLYWVDSMIAPFSDADGKIEKYISIRLDITAAKLAKAELQKTTERFSLAADGAGIGVWEFDVVANTLTWDDWMYRLYGRARESGLEPYDVWSTSLHPDDRARSEQELQWALRGERDFDTEFRIVQPDGQQRYLKASARVVRDVAGNPVRMTGVNLDVTDRKKMELELVETSSLLQSVLESASEVSLIATDPNLMIRVFNKGAETLLGYRSEEVVNRTTPILLHDLEEVRLRAEELTAQSGEMVEGGAAFIHPLALRQPREWTYVRKDGSRITVSLVVTAMIGDDGALFGYLGVAHDVTLQKQHERSLREAILTAERANLAKSRFLANMSHEIRTPMNAVIGLSHLLGETPLDAEQSVFLAKIKLASKSLLALINDILDFSKIEAGELDLERVPFDLRVLLANLEDVMRVQADAKHIALVAEIADDLPAGVVGDATRLNQILTNLLSNAIKFTDQGRVTLRVCKQGETPSQATMRFDVIDSGIGIPADVQKRLFVPFAQADASTTRRFGGTGLGLSIVKRLVDLMAGQVTLTSTPGTGSVFSVIVSFDLAGDSRRDDEAPFSALVENASLLGVRVLIVDDSDVNLFVAQRLLEKQGAQVSIANTGQEACARLSADPRGTDLVLMDVQMPGLDGYETTEKIRRELGLMRLPIIALTADALVSERERAARAGMNDFVSKPFEPTALFAIIKRHVDANAEALPLLLDSAALPPRESDADWPPIEGIDTHDACTRLGGDVPMFRGLLAMFLREFGELRSPAGDVSSENKQAFTARLHKLRGAAGQIGARTIHQLASAAETAMRGSDTARAAALGQQIQVHLGRLLTAADVVVAAPPTAIAEASRAPGADLGTVMDPLALEKLLTMLRQQDLSVLQLVSAAAAQLRASLGDDVHQRLRASIDHLQFKDAALLLEEHLSEARGTVEALGTDKESRPTRNL